VEGLDGKFCLADKIEEDFWNALELLQNSPLNQPSRQTPQTALFVRVCFFIIDVNSIIVIHKYILISSTFKLK